MLTNLDLQQPYESLQLDDDCLKDLSLKNVAHLSDLPGSGSAGRHDYAEYAEMTELVIVLLGDGDQLPSRPRWRMPDANHRARGMANCLYEMRMFA